MLKARVLTALVLAPLFLWAVLAWSTPYLAVLFAFVLILGAWEWARLIQLDAPLLRAGYLLSFLLILVAAQWYLAADLTLLPLLALAGLWWLVVLLWLGRFSRGAGQPLHSIGGALVGYVVLAPAWLALVWLHQEGGWYWLLLLLLLVWSADVGAYFTGRALGRHKLAPRVSPGKTWEGVAGGAVCAVLVVGLVHLWAGRGELPLAVLLPVGLITVLFSVVGDLFESMVKRQRGVKDSSQLLPGHGGVLDRVDSITAAAPLFALGLLWWRAFS